MLCLNEIQSTPMLVFPDFNKPFFLETDTSKKGLGMVLSEKQDDGCYHHCFGSHSPYQQRNIIIALSLNSLLLSVASWSISRSTSLTCPL